MVVVLLLITANAEGIRGGSGRNETECFARFVVGGSSGDERYRREDQHDQGGRGRRDAPHFRRGPVYECELRSEQRQRAYEVQK